MRARAITHARLAATAGLTCLFASAATAQTGLPWTSTFEGGSFGEWNASVTPNLAVLESNCSQGRFCARAPLTQGTHSDNYADHDFGDFFRLRLQKVEEVYLRLYSKFETGYAWPNDSQKIAILNLTDGTTSERRYNLYIYVDRNGRYAVDHSYWQAWRFFALTQNVGTPVIVRPDQWDKLKLHVRLNTPGAADGVVRLWVNDVLKISHTNVNIRESTAYGMNRLNLSSYAMDASGSDGVQWYDDWTLSLTDPDATAVATAPQPPSNLVAQ